MNAMLENLMLLVIYGIEAVKFMIGAKLVLRENNQKRWMYLVGAGITICYLVIAGRKANSLIIYVLVICITYFTVNGRNVEKLVRVLLLSLLLLSIDETSAGVTRTFVDNNSILLKFRFTNIFLDSLWGLIVVSVIFLLEKDRLELKSVSLSKNKIFVIILLNGMIMILAIGVLNYLKAFVKDEGFQIFATFLVSMAYLCMSLLCWLLVYLRSLNEQATKELSAEKKLNIYRSNYYIKLIEKEEETRKFRHDINNHFMYLTSLVYENDMESVKNYLRELNQEILKIQKSIFITGNNLFDVILNEKLQEVRKETKILITGKASCKLKVSDIDMCIIFANLIDNAIEAVGKVKEKSTYIIIKFRTGHNYLKISIKNSTSKKILMKKNGLPKTTKGNERLHGIGLINVKETVEKYSGDFKISSNEKEFSVEIILPIEAYFTDDGVL